jgi:biotin carboxyl carrier protein
VEADELQQLALMLRASGFNCLELSRPGEFVKLTMARRRGSAVAVNEEDQAALGAFAPAHTASAATVVRAESAGLFLAAHPARHAPFARVGDTVRKDDVLGLAKIGPIYAPVTAPADGVVTRIIATDGALLGFGSPVMELGPLPG